MTQARFPQRSSRALSQKRAVASSPISTLPASEPGRTSHRSSVPTERLEAREADETEAVGSLTPAGTVGPLSPASPKAASLAWAGRGYRATKRALDIASSSIGLVALSPLFAGVALAIKIDSPGPVFCKQTRVGLDGRTFGCYKFRSMHPDAEKLQADLAHLNERTGPIFKIKDDPRVTRLGKFLRKSSLDELPQLLNVLRGEMSLVGPRPPLPKEVALYQSHHFRRLEVVPGITGLQQVTARDENDFEKWVSLDVQYIEKRCFALDLWILMRTPLAVLFGRGAC